MVKRKAKTKKRPSLKKKEKKVSPIKSVLREKPTDDFKLKRTKIRIIGVGGGGSSIVSEIASKIKKATFVSANTDRQALKEVHRNVIRFQFGEKLTHGLGTGMNPELGETAALEEKDRIKELFKGQDLCIIVACLGGGTGSGAAHVFAKTARNSGALTYGIFTMPFKFEGDKKMAIAKKALEELKPKLNAISVIPNESVFKIIEKETPLKQSLSAINERLCESLGGLIELIFDAGLINIDFADLKTILQGTGRLTYLNTSKTKLKEGVVQEVIENLLNSPLYPYGIKGARSVLYNIAGEKGLALSEIDQISKTISGLANKEAKIIFGLAQNQKHRGVIKTTILATGCGTKIFSEESKNQKKRKKIKTKKRQKKDKKEVVKEEKKMKNIVRKKPKKKKIKNIKKSKKVKIKFKKSISKTSSVPKKEKIAVFQSKATEFRVRKNALQLKKEAELIEEEMLEKEKFWETPAFLRRKRIV
ncbi:cell division protein FtsZ [Patescibacteria group bacterium]